MAEYAKLDVEYQHWLYDKGILPSFNDPWHFDYITIPKDTTMTQYPMIIDETYVPQVGDKIESTKGDTVLIGVVDRWGGPIGLQSDGNYNYHNPVTAHDKSGMLLYINRDNGWAYRLLSRKPRSLKVGDIISGEEVGILLTPGSIVTKMNVVPAYDIVVLNTDEEYSDRSRCPFHRVDKGYAWPRITGDVRIKYINN